MYVKASKNLAPWLIKPLFSYTSISAAFGNCELRLGLKSAFFQHLRGLHSKSVADPEKSAERDVELPALDGAVVGPVHLYVVSERVLA